MHTQIFDGAILIFFCEIDLAIFAFKMLNWLTKFQEIGNFKAGLNPK